MSTTSLAAVAARARLPGGRDPRGLTDRQLLDRFALDRDEAAFAELVRRHGPMVLGLCRRVLRREHDAEDAFQAAFLVLVRKAGAVRGAGSVAGWLYRVTHRVAWRALAAAERRQPAAVLDDVPDPRREVPHEGVRECLDRELGRLPEQYRAPVVLCYLEGRSQPEAAALLGTTAGAVNSRLRRARGLLRQRLARAGVALSCAAVAEALAFGAARAAPSPALARHTARIALEFVASRALGIGPAALVAAVARGALHAMTTANLKIITAVAGLAALLGLAAVLLTPPALGEDPPAAAASRDDGKLPKAGAKEKPGGGKAKAPRSIIILWLQGGPSQFETFDPKPKSPEGTILPASDTVTKGVQIGAALPRLTKLTDRLTIIRSLTHNEGDHQRATYLMQTGRPAGGAVEYPALGAVLGTELRQERDDLPRFVRVAPGSHPALLGPGGGCLGTAANPLPVGLEGAGRIDEALRQPPVEAFEALVKGRGEKMRKATEAAFDLSREKAEVRKAYGMTAFGQGCLLARRLTEAGVPAVEVVLPGWDTHANAVGAMPKLCENLDAALSALLKDLHDRGRLDSTLVVVMGEFGRTPRVNPQGGRDHWPRSFSVVLAGAGVKGGRAVGKTSKDGARVDERPVTPAELHATVYKALGIDLGREYRAGPDRRVPVVEKGTKAVQEALR